MYVVVASTELLRGNLLVVLKKERTILGRPREGAVKEMCQKEEGSAGRENASDRHPH